MATATIEEISAEAEAERLREQYRKHFQVNRADTWRRAWDDADLLDGELEALRLLWVEQDPIAARNAYDEAMSEYIDALIQRHIDNGTTPPNF